MNSAVLPASLHAAIEEKLGMRVLDATAQSGGMINQTAQLQTPDGTLFVKWNNNAPPQFFAKEARGLEALRATKTLRVPEVITVSDEAAVPFLVLEWIEPKIVWDKAAFARSFAHGLAALHRTVALDGQYGWSEDNYLGALPQQNSPRGSWPEFYRDCRLMPQIEMARGKGLLPADREALLMQIIEKTPVLLGGFSSRPSLLHGDLWSGNYLVGDGEAVLIDPAVHYGEREVEIAFIELFGGFPSGFLTAYNEAFPLEDGYESRRQLHQLYPLLVHLNLFGETYSADVERTCRAILRNG
ncbi:MAG TPA: fructosamine kinase family protein [Abditibacteriaceae bacterium]|jgi:fructosamine-3-kinase